MKLITFSSTQAYRTCPRLYWQRYVLSYRPIRVDEALSFGTLIHRGLETILTSNWSAKQLYRFIWTTEATDFDRVKAAALLSGYMARWQDEPMQIVAVEQTFQMPLINPATGAASRTFQLAGKIDAIVVANGQLWVMEHKTSAQDISPGSQYWQQLCIDPQISTYILAAKELGHDAAGCIYDVLGKPRTKPHRATPPENRKYKKDGSLYANQRAEDETLEEYAGRLRNDIAADPERYYQRGEVVRLAAEEAEAQFDLWHTARMIRESELAGRWPRNTDGCFKYNRPCDFWPVCTGESSLEDRVRYKQDDNVHPELEDSNGTQTEAA